ncbi:MAG: oligosaccharide flippase family protein [Dehalococcoidales bacterium]|nr:oligosaccharide flippase family protein [Dehalococcoidales bacterium]
MVNSAVTAGLGFFFWMVVARIYNTNDVGYGSAALSAISLLAALSLFGANITVIRFLPKAEKPNDLINTCLTLCGLIAIVIAVVFVLGLDLWSPALRFIQRNAIYAIAFIFFVIVSTFSTITDAIYVAKRRANYVLIMDATYSLLKIPLPFLLVLFFRSFGIASSLGIAVAIAVTIGLFVLVPRAQKGYRIKPALNRNLIGNLWRYSIGNYLATVLHSAHTWILPIIIINVLGSTQNAYFYITWVLAGLLGAIPTATANSLFAEGSHFEEDLQFNIRKALRFTYLLLIPAIVVMLLAGGWILSLFGSQYSINGTALLRIMAVAGVFLGVNYIYNTILRIENRIKELCLIYAFQTIAILMASYLLINRVGTIGVGYAWLGTQFTVSLYVIFNLIKRYRLKYKGYKDKKPQANKG